MKTYALVIAVLLVVLPGTASAQPLRLEDPNRAQERWQRNFDRENREQARDARDREQDRAILRELEDQRMRDSEREFRESIRERQRQEEREEDRQERRCPPGYHFNAYYRECEQ